MTVKHTGPKEDLGEGKVHKGTKGGTTGCGTNTNVKPSHWVNSSQSITCNKNGCKN